MKQILSRLYDENFTGHVALRTKSGNLYEFDFPSKQMSDCDNNTKILEIEKQGYIYYIGIESIESIKILPKK